MEKQNLNIVPGGILPVIHCSQGDIGREFQINLFSDNAPYVLDGTEELTIDGHKEDNNIFSYSLPSTTGSTITISTEEQMTACAGNVICEIRIYKGTMRIGTCNFIIQVEEGVSNGTPSESTIQSLDEIRAEVQQAVTDAQTAQHNAEIAESNAETAEANARYAQGQSESARDSSQSYANDSKNWAVGPSGSGSGTDTNNSKHYSEQSAESATDSELSALVSEGYAKGSQNDVDVPSTSIYYHNNAKYYSEQADNSASNAHTSETNASNSASSASQSASNAHTSEVNASNSASDANTAKLGAESAQQKIENMTASASQLPEGSNPSVDKSEVGGVVHLAFGIPKGDTGATGATGQDGVSPEVSINTISGGHSVTITDAEHPSGQTFNVMDGEDGLGVPSGGTTGQILAKASDTDNDTEWIDAPSGGGNSNTNINLKNTISTTRKIELYSTTADAPLYTANCIWTDGKHIYYSSGTTHYEFVDGVWKPKTWNGLTNFNGQNVWSDGTEIYYSNSTDQYVLNVATDTWTTKTWSGLTSFEGANVWSDGTNIYYNNASLTYQLVSGIWVTKPWSGDGQDSVVGKYVWTDGINYYFSYFSNEYVIDVINSRIESRESWDGLLSFSGDNVWSDGINVYYNARFTRKMLITNTDGTKSWTDVTWSGLSGFSGGDVFTDGNNIFINYYNSMDNSTYTYIINSIIDSAKPKIIIEGEEEDNSILEIGYIESNITTTTPVQNVATSDFGPVIETINGYDVYKTVVAFVNSTGNELAVTKVSIRLPSEDSHWYWKVSAKYVDAYRTFINIIPESNFTIQGRGLIISIPNTITMYDGDTIFVEFEHVNWE